MNLSALLQIVRQYIPKANLNVIKNAFNIVANPKKSGNTEQIKHCLNTAKNLARLGFGSSTIAISLLHDAVKESPGKLEKIKNQLGAEFSKLSEKINNLGAIKYKNIEKNIEHSRKMFIKVAEDIRVIFIKFADTLYDLKTTNKVSEEKKFKIAKESLEIYAPIANRLGMNLLKDQLENLAFSYAYPKEFKNLKELTLKNYKNSHKLIKKTKIKLAKTLHKENISYIAIQGRSKRLYSLYKKLLKHNGEIIEINDIIALRVITSDIESCYVILNIINRLWEPIKHRFKDYIITPKMNGYQSLHTTVFCGHKIVEFQIMTRKMHEDAEYGVAAHWCYDDNISFQNKHNLKWITRLNNWRKEISKNKSYIKNPAINIFKNKTFIFTPKKDIIDLPAKSTPIDFAYHLNRELGDKCVAAKVNGHIEKLDTKKSRINAGLI